MTVLSKKCIILCVDIKKYIYVILHRRECAEDYYNVGCILPVKRRQVYEKFLSNRHITNI